MFAGQRQCAHLSLTRSAPSGPRAWPTTPMTHIAIQEALDGKIVEWMEKVSDEEYLASLGKEYN